MTSLANSSQYLQAVWKLRYFWLSLVRIDLRARYRRSVMGVGWSLLNPIAMTAVLCMIFVPLFNQELRNYAPFLLVGITFWNYVSNCLKEGCQSLFQSEHYIRQYPAPMAIYPLRTMLGAAFHFGLAMCVAAAMTAVVRGLEAPLLLPFQILPVFVLLLVLGWSLATIAAFTNAHFPDTHQIVEVGLQIVFYGTPIIYPPEMLRDKPNLAWIADYNPLGAFLELLRRPILDGQFGSMHAVSVACLTTSLVFLAAIFMLVKYQRKIIFQL